MLRYPRIQKMGLILFENPDSIDNSDIESQILTIERARQELEVIEWNFYPDYERCIWEINCYGSKPAIIEKRDWVDIDSIVDESEGEDEDNWEYHARMDTYGRTWDGMGSLSDFEN